MPGPLPLPSDYASRVYAGVLGKMIGVYLGRPFEQWSHATITSRLGEVSYYVHDRLGVPLVVADDDLSGTFTFLRALDDAGGNDLTPRDVADAWLNYIVPGRSILWWGGMGVSTEHTAFARLKAGVQPPASGSISLNGKVVAEQIGAQIFIDGWGLVNPGDPDRAADMARRAACVSHDGVAIDGAVVVAAMVAAAFDEHDTGALIDTGLARIPRDSLLHALVDDLRNVRARSSDWRDGLRRIHDRWSYELYGGGCHLVPNHAIVHLALLWGGGSFAESMKIGATAGYDTDCNLANIGCVLGVAGGLTGLDREGVDWRGPVADRLLIPTADGGGCVTDAVAVTRRVVSAGRKLRGLPPVPAPRRWAFELPGSVQGWVGDTGQVSHGSEGLLLPQGTSRVAVFVSKQQMSGRGSYALTACPTAYPGQRFTAELRGEGHARLVARHYSPGDELVAVSGPVTHLARNAPAHLALTLPETGGHPYFDLGVELLDGRAELAWADLDRSPRFELRVPEGIDPWDAATGRAWLWQWVNAADQLGPGDPRHDALLTLNAESTGMVLTGHESWGDYSLHTTLRVHLARRVLVGVRMQGLNRGYFLTLGPGPRLSWLRRSGRDEHELATCPLDWPWYLPLPLAIHVEAARLTAEVAGTSLSALDPEGPFKQGGIAFGVEAGHIAIGPLTIGK